jgi:hypothetical protein
MTAILLVDDPEANHVFDLRAVLERGRVGPLVAVARPGERLANDSAPAAIVAASAVSAGAPVPMRAYVVENARTPFASEQRPVGAAVEALVAAAGTPPAALVVFVSVATLPLVEALHADPRTRTWLRLGITDVKLDPAYTLAQKLVFDRKLHYHEHTLSLERLLDKRLHSMWEAHAARPVPAAPEPTVDPGAAAP